MVHISLLSLFIGQSAAADCVVQSPTDHDGDGFGNPIWIGVLCNNGAPILAPLAKDCDDTDPEVYPGAPEQCSGVDNDCDGTTDNKDSDGDGYYDDSCTIGGSAGMDCDDTRSWVNPVGIEDVWTVWDEDCDGLSDNGKVHSLSFSGKFEFTGSNMIADPDEDATFELGTLSANWELYVSTHGYGSADMTVSSSVWSSSTLNGSFPAFDVLVPGTPSGVANECAHLKPAAFMSGFTVGDDYGVKIMIQNPSTTNNNGFHIYTKTAHDAGGTPLEARSIWAGDEEQFVAHFVPSVSTESLVFCWGNWQGTAGSFTHIEVGPGDYTP